MDERACHYATVVRDHLLGHRKHTGEAYIGLLPGCSREVRPADSPLL